MVTLIKFPFKKEGSEVPVCSLPSSNSNIVSVQFTDSNLVFYFGELTNHIIDL